MSEQKTSRLSRAERQRQIIDTVLASGFASISQLVELTGVSVMTVHRDVDDLASRGLVRKLHGGVSALPTSVFESSSDFRLQRNAEAKAALARTALEFVDPGMSVLLDDSTTVLALAGLLPQTAPLTVLTNYRLAMEVLREEPDIQLIAIGGQYSRTHDSFIGPPSDTGLDAYAVDIVFQSTSTVDESTAYHQEQDVVVMKRVMLRAGTQRVLMIDGTKTGRTSLHRFVALSEFTDVIVTDDAPPAVLAAMRDQTRVHVAPLR
ncbi:DeoR/GlpR family DNA-binding transcription regulator [Mumia zhuanghuii]|uniref:DeoR/GlpR transcriptional regulator n=1 Tax=Mumia zhuanghuii TaxID=2585211 RepID=A0A5C4MBW9_9ACTN|nr:DeoR/GlpR family DNA-binding transcription regulator [Mumia zhuanghuii]TNC35440.1 DeoR/GlpR transcriptional regulator [Mumia zhuanghuii]